MSLNNPFQLATEVIAFQHDGFAEKFAAHIGQARDTFRKSKKTKADTDAMGESICEFLTARFGIKLTPSMESFPHYFAIMPPLMDHNHVFYTEKYYREFVADLVGKDLRRNVNTVLAEKTNSLSLAKATVSGGFSKVECTLYIPRPDLQDTQLSDDEIAAVLLHEVGHAFTFFEFLGRTTAVNQMLAIVHDDAFLKATPKDIEYMVARLGSKDAHLVENLQNSKDGKKRVAVLLKNFVEEPSTVSLTAHYDATTCEALADNFVARFGYGKHLVLALDRICRYDPSYTTGRVSDVMGNIVTCAVILLYGGGLLVLFGPIALGVVACVILFMVVKNSGEAGRDFTYDRLRVRYLRVREQMVKGLKDRDAPNAAAVLKDLEQVDEILKTMRDYNGPIDRFCNWVFSKDKESLASANLQRVLEEIASNDLYVKAAQLRQAQPA